MSFEQFRLSQGLLKAIAQQGYTQPTPIQEQSIPAILKGRDIIATAQTGTGKTASFSLPIIERLSKAPVSTDRRIRALILTPTRELAGQILDCIRSYTAHSKIRSEVVFGGVKINPQIEKLKDGTDILVATPGRLLDLIRNNILDLRRLEVFTLDEADRMLDMGFIHDVRKVIKKLPPNRQNLMFSATFNDKISALAKSIVRDPVEISVTPKNSTTKLINHWIHPVDKKKKPALLAHLILSKKWKQVLVFTRTKHGANRLTTYLQDRGIAASAIHGNKSQNARTKALQQFKAGEITALVATDIAARGLDIEQLPQVVNFDLPNVAEDYVHRIGRTGRAGVKGKAISLVAADEIDQLVDIEKLIKMSLKREYVPGYEPNHELPQSKQKKAVSKPASKPKKAANARYGKGAGPKASNKPKHNKQRRYNRTGPKKSAA